MTAWTSPLCAPPETVDVTCSGRPNGLSASCFCNAAWRASSKKRSLVDRQRLFLHQRDLLAQLEDPVLPVALGVEPRERRRKGRVVPAPRDPSRVMDQAQGAQRFEEIQLRSLEFHELLVAGEHRAQL